jgi:hypothetical protein
MRDEDVLISGPENFVSGKKINIKVDPRPQPGYWM